MRKFMLVGAAAAMALLASLSMSTTALASPAATHDVLTSGKAGGANVATGAILKASLASKTTALFNAGKSGKITCKTSSVTDKVTKNPAKPGTADLSLTAQSFSKCSAADNPNFTGVKSVTVNKLPYTTTISDSKGDPVSVSKTQVTLDLDTTVGVVTCVYKASSTHGSASNKTQTITFSNQEFKKSSGPEVCPSSGKFSATYGPVLDTSVKGDPHVFVN
jgi:hypothetical protein